MSAVKLLYELHRRGYQFQTPAAGKKFNLQEIMAKAFKMEPKTAIEYLKARGGQMTETWSYKEMEADAHQTAFTVAKVMAADALQDIYDEVLKAKTNGLPLTEFKKNVLSKLESRGWIGGVKEQINPHTGEPETVKLTPNRLKVIYDTNLQTSFAKGKYKQQQLLGERYPILVYKQVQRKSKRDVHAKFHDKAFRYNDPIWKSIYPPSDYACKCSVIQMTEEEARKKGYKVESGDKYKELVTDEKEFQIKSVEAWTPDTTKYVNGIKKQLDQMLSSNQVPNEAPVEPKEKAVVTDNDVHTYRNLLPQLVNNKNNTSMKDIVKFLTKKAKAASANEKQQYYDLIDEYNQALNNLKSSKPVSKPLPKKEPVQPVSTPKEPDKLPTQKPATKTSGKKVKIENKKVGWDEYQSVYTDFNKNDKEHKDKFNKKYINNYARTDYINTLRDKKHPDKNLTSHDVWNSYIGGGYYQINNALRNEDTSSQFYENGKFLQNTDLNHEFNINNAALFRGEQAASNKSLDERIRSLADNSDYQTNMLLSTSFSPKTASDFGMADSDEYPTLIYKINMPDKFNAGFGTDYEQEVILRKGSKFRIKNITRYEIKTESGDIVVKYFVEMDYLSTGPNLQ